MRLLISAAKLKYAILGQKTRWSSTHAMLERLLVLKEFCIEKSETLPGLRLSSARWDALAEMCAVLKPMAQLTTQLQYEDLDVAQMVGFWKTAMFTLNRINTTASKKLRKWIEPREKAVVSNKIVLASIYVDKRFGLTLEAGRSRHRKRFHSWTHC